MSIASEITRLQGVKSNILDAIAAKGVSVPSGAMLDDCPELIAAISGGGGITVDSLVRIVPINKLVVVDENGYIGYDFTAFINPDPYNYYSFAILSTEDFSQAGLGQVTIYTPSIDCIGGRTYRTTTIGNQIWLAENLDFKIPGCMIGYSTANLNDIPQANYYNNDEATYGVNGNKRGLLYNWAAVDILVQNKDILIPGWRVPSADDFLALQNTVGTYFNAGRALKVRGWGDNSTDPYGFSAVPSGCVNGNGNNNYLEINTTMIMWSSTPDSNTSKAVRRYITQNSASFDRDAVSKDYRFSLRLVRDAD